MTKQELYSQYYTKQYSFQDFQNDFNYCYKQLVALFPEIQKNNYNLIFNYTALQRFGQCSNKGRNKFEIQLNYHFAQICDKEAILDTIMHELTHSLKDCMCHTGRWKSVCNRVNHEYNYDLARTATYPEYKQFRRAIKPRKTLSDKYKIVCDHCGQDWIYSKQTKIVKELQARPHSLRFKCPYCQNQEFSLSYISQNCDDIN